jgi:hypothetical protein
LKIPILNFDVESAVLCVTGDNKALELFEWLLGPRRLAKQMNLRRIVTIKFQKARAAANATLNFVEEKTTQSGVIIQLYRANDRVLVVTTGDQLQLDLFADGSSIISGAMVSDVHQHGQAELALMALNHAITAVGQAFVHAACLALPDASSAILLHAKSGTGKTTTSFALTHEGYKIIGDDAAVIQCEQGAGIAIAWGIPRAPKVHRNTVNDLPFLKKHSVSEKFNNDGEQFLDRQKLIESKIIIDKSLINISAIVSLSRHMSAGPSITKVGPFEGLHDLLEDNLSNAGSLLMPNDSQKLDIYSAMIRCTPCYRVNLNGSPLDMAHMIAEQFA